MASSCGHSEVAKILIEAAASKDEGLKAKDGLKVKADPRSGRHPLHWAAENGNGRVLEVLLEAKGCSEDVDVEDIYGRTPLVLAAYGGYVECLKILIAKVKWLMIQGGPKSRERERGRGE